MKFTLTIDPAKPYIRDMTREGWTLPDGDIEYHAGEVEVELAEVLESYEGRITGTEMAKRAKKLGANLGQKHAEAFLAKYERWAPPEGVFYITFPGTVLLGRDGGRYVPYLDWYGGRWCLDFFWLGFSWFAGDRFLRPRK